jgi:DNA-binding cell septation regulator SpoVG
MSTLDISKVVCYPTKYDSGSTVGFGMISFNEVLTVKFNIIRAKSGDLFVSWPQRKKAESEEYTTFVTFEDKDAREDIQKVIITEYNKALSITSRDDTKRTPKEVTPEEKPAAKAGAGSIKWGGRK